MALAGLILAGAAYPAIADGLVLRAEIAWLPSLGLNFSLRMDGFAWMFTVLVTGIGFLVVLYARYYLSPEDPMARFFSYLLGFMGAMLGIVLSGNLGGVADRVLRAAWRRADVHRMPGSAPSEQLLSTRARADAGHDTGAGGILIGSMICFSALETRPVLHEILSRCS